MARDKIGEVVRGQFFGSLVHHVRELGFSVAVVVVKKKFFFKITDHY